MSTPVLDFGGTVGSAPIGPTIAARMRALGIPKPQGSKVPFVTADGRKGVREQNAASHRSWRDDVAHAAAEVRAQLDGPLDGPLGLEVTFRFPMPASRPAGIRRAGIVLKTSAPDTSKLVRSIEDSMEAAGLIVNDARFAVIHAAKVEVTAGEWTGADITIRRLA